MDRSHTKNHYSTNLAAADTPSLMDAAQKKKKKEWTIESDKDYGAREDQFKLSMGSSENLVAKGDQFCDAQVGGGTAGARSLRLG